MRKRIEAVCWCVVLASLPFGSRAEVVDLGLKDYVSDGLVANWDGVFNVGTAVFHDSSVAEWTDLVSGRKATFTAVSGRTGGMGHWATNGYRFAGASYAVLENKWGLGNVFTVQVVCDYTLSDHVGISYPNYFAGPDDFCIFTSKTAAKLQWKTNPAGENTRPELSSWKGKYITGVFGSEKMYLTQTASYANEVTRSGSQAVKEQVWTFGGSASGAADRVSIGTIHAVRIYNRELTEDELAVNYAVDERRFRQGRVNADVVVATDTPGLHGVQPPGTYGVIEDHLFCAPSIVVTNGVTYALRGYRLETWNAEARTWMGAETRFSSMYRHVAGDDTVRLTWLWSAEGGLLRYSIGDYVQRGLKVQFDGIRNVAADAAHAETAEKWNELVSDGDITASFHLTTNNLGWGAWTDAGYAFSGGDYGLTDSALPALGKEFTVQCVLDCDVAKQSDMRYSNYISYTRGDYGMFTSRGGNKVTWKMDAVSGGPWTEPPGERAVLSGWKGKYLTGICTADEIALIQGVSTNGAAFQKRALFNDVESYLWVLGGAISGSDGGTAERCCTATLNGVRMYDRVLTNDELAHNQEIDEVRFRGANPATNGVVVATDEAGAEGFEPTGVYRLYGAYSFTASRTVNAAGRTVLPKGCTVETWNADTGDWDGAVWNEGPVCTLSDGGAALRRITWSWTVPSLRIFIR